MSLAHFTRVTPTATDLSEVLYGNLFEVNFVFPSILNLSSQDQDIMMLNTLNIDLNLTEDLQSTKQRFKYSTRLYLKTPETTSIEDMSFDFNINVDDNYSMRTWNYLKKWYDLAWNSQTGELHYKRDMVGQIIAHIHDREGNVIRRVEFKNVQIKGVGGHTFGWEDSDFIKGKAKFMCDYWIDQYYDIK